MRGEKTKPDDKIARDVIKKKEGWDLEPHICVKCFGRIVSKPLPDGQMLYRCTICGRESTGDSPKVACCCGMKIKRAGKHGTKSGSLIDAGVRCIPNPAPSAEWPNEIVASEIVRA